MRLSSPIKCQQKGMFVLIRVCRLPFLLAFSSLVQGQSTSSMPALVVVPFLLGPMGPTAVGLLPERDRGDSDASLLLFLLPPLLRPPASV
ncbi:hypothetical protein BDA96_07G099100 [Sorghum bicolor]|uniref:Uncharacterized protein n=1 Tax=Sorghum bicolor TaxID=4558 RepID=A0A921U990_SORBI|nr:hypothetical protein BDA96_07G099100 [Sorghum bicolor]